MKIGAIFFAAIIFGVSAQTWVSRARLSNFNAYFTETLQQVIFEIEKREWCNLKIEDMTVVVNEHMYRWHVTGNVTYTNGFMISIQRIDLSNIESLFTSRIVNGVVQATGTVRGLINFRDSSVGFDVVFKSDDGSEQRYTGVYIYTLINYRATISRNFHTGEIVISVDVVSMNPAVRRMIFMPENNVTEVLSRQTFIASSIRNSVQSWGRDIMQPILEKLVIEKVEFPSICFVNC